MPSPPPKVRTRMACCSSSPHRPPRMPTTCRWRSIGLQMIRTLNLNQHAKTTAPLFSRDVSNLGNRDLVPYEGQDVYAELDLSAVNDLTAFVRMYYAGGQWNCGAAFWTPTDGLRERAERDK